MKFEFITILSLAVLSLPGNENLLLNPQFASGKEKLVYLSPETEKSFPTDWKAGDRPPEYLRRGGPENLAALSFTAPRSTLSQYGMRLNANCKYKFKAKIKLTDFESEQAYAALYDYCWAKDVKLRLPERGTTGWIDFEGIFTARESPNNLYGLGIHVRTRKGEIRIADVSLSPVDPAAAKGIHLPESEDAAHLIPTSLNLGNLPVRNASIRFSYPLRLPLPDDAYECVLEINGKTFSAPWHSHQAEIGLGEQRSGKSSFTAVLREKQGKIITRSRKHHCRFVPVPPQIPGTKGRQLNVQVSELVNEQVKSGKISFINPRDGWIFIALETKTAAPELLLDGRKMTLRKHGTRFETMRHLSAGKHAATVSKAEPSDKVIVRTVPVLFCYPALRRNIMPQEGTYDWDFTEKYILPACNTFNFYGLPGGEKDRLKLQERGVELLGSRTFRVGKPFEGRDAFVKYISKPVKNLEGYTLDEVAFVDWPGMIQPVVESLWSLSAAESRTSFNLWVGFPSKFGIFPVLHQDLLAALGNSFSGNSRILYETYCKTAYSEKKAEEYLNGMLRTPIILSNRMAPGIKRQIYLITAAYMNMTGWSQDLFPQTDIRYYLDMQMNMIANDPVFRDLGGFGIYCINRTESETTRWIFRLFRHYFVEGNREMLSKKYGFRFFPGHLQNTDFFHQGKYWNAESAEKNSIVFTRSLAFEKLQNRSGSDSHCCIMTRSAKAPNKLYQTARGLVPGKTYSFKVFAADLDAVETTAFQPGKLTFKVDLEGADIDRRRSYVFYPQKKNADNRVNINVIKIIFKATAPTMKICFSDWQNSTTPGGRIGQRLAFNFIQLRAFFEEETL